MGQLPKTSEVVIIGAGAIGLSVARSLALRGVRDVLVIERGAHTGAEASAAAAGMLAPQAEADCADDFFQLCRRSRDQYPAFAAALAEETGIDIELDDTGTLYLGLTENDVIELERRFEWQTEAGLVVERLSASEARKLEPAISQQARLALRFPFDTQVENRLLANALTVSCQRMGVQFSTATSATSIRRTAGRITGVETSRGFVATANLIIAAGAWSSQLLLSTDTNPDLNRARTEARGSNYTAPDSDWPNLGIEPVRGQLLCFEAVPQLIDHIIYSPRGYLVPRKDGRLLAGSTSEYAGFDKSVTEGATQSIREAAVEISPRVGSLAMKDAWTGLRPRASDGLPVIGPCAEIDGLFFASGHYRNGILLSPITGELIAAIVIDRLVSDLIAPFSPDRFAPVLAI